MVLSNVKLTAKNVLEKDFKIAMRGYNQEEVDKFLDVVIKDYEMFYKKIEELEKENERLKKHGEASAVRPTAPPASGTTNFDILKRLSNLEKHVFGSKLYE